MISAGNLDQRITVQNKTVAKNSIGEEISTWGDLITVWAEVIPLRGNAFFTANQQQHAVDVRFRIRERTGIAENMRIIWRGKSYDITSIIPGTAKYKGTLELVAVNGVFDG